MSVPAAQPIERHRANPDYRDADAWAVIEVDLASLPSKAVRINISIQQRVLAVVDEVARQEGDTRSGLLQRAVTEYIDRSGVKATTAASRRAQSKPRKRRKRTAYH